MFALFVEVDTSGAGPEAVDKLRDEIVPRVSQAPGFKSGAWMRPNEHGKGLALIVFEAEENARAAAGQMAVGSNPQPGVTVERSEVREVAATA
jgi:hypothetical protein